MREDFKPTKEEIYAFFQTVQTGVITDALTRLGLEGWMDDVYPMRPEERLFGKAFTVKLSPVRSKDEPTYTFYDLYDKFEEGDIVVVGGDETKCSLSGENLAHLIMYAGAGGMVLNGRCRDYGEIRDLPMPVFCKGPTVRLRTKYQKFTDYNVKINCAGAQVWPGDYILGDIDGVLVIPADRIVDVMYQAQGIQEMEAEMEAAIKRRAPREELKAIIARKKVIRE